MIGAAKRLPGKEPSHVSRKSPSYSDRTVFLNIPYDDRFKPLYIAYIVGLAHLGLTPRATLEITNARNRMDKIIELIQMCQFSIHDLSRVQIDRKKPATPRFNMPFELGLAVAIDKYQDHSGNWLVFESVSRRVSKSLSDLNGIDPFIHGDTARGVLQQLGNAFAPSGKAKYSLPRVYQTYTRVSRMAGEILKETGCQNLFEANSFRQLQFIAARVADRS